MIRSPRRFVGTILCLAAWYSTAAAAEMAGPLAQYAHSVDESYHWTVRDRSTYEGGRVVELLLTSQTWRDELWKHQLFLFRPERLVEQSSAVLFIGGEDWNEALESPPVDGEHQLPPQAERYQQLADATGGMVAVVLQVPRQPMFGELVEDELVSLTFSKYMETHDATWPLLVPMVKSVVRAMDAVQEFSQQEWSLDLAHFTVSGASKRGWTTWLIAAVDPRVQCMAPMVIDMLNVQPQMMHQLRSWGQFSEQISDYTRVGLQKELSTEAGRELMKIVDPYAYRDVLTQPKLVLLGTNDPYWPIDALNLYWNDLPAPKRVLYLPNNTHKLNDESRIVGTLTAMHKAALGHMLLPELDWTLTEDDAGLHLRMTSDRQPTQVRVWTTTSDNRDFRSACWTSQSVEPHDDAWSFDLPRGQHGFQAMFGEYEFAGDSLPYYFSTNLRIIGPKLGATAGGIPSLLRAFLRISPASQPKGTADDKETAAADDDAQHAAAEETGS